MPTVDPRITPIGAFASRSSPCAKPTRTGVLSSRQLLNTIRHLATTSSRSPLNTCCNAWDQAFWIWALMSRISSSSHSGYLPTKTPQTSGPYTSLINVNRSGVIMQIKLEED